MTTPDASEAWLDGIFAAIDTDCKLVGWFDKVQGHEITTAPGHGLAVAYWLQRGPRPLRGESGLDKSSALLIFFVRIYSAALAEPRDAIDPHVAKANSALMRRWHDNYDFGLHPTVRNVDLYGISGFQLDSVAGYEPIDETDYRVMTITLPIICNDVWPIGS